MKVRLKAGHEQRANVRGWLVTGKDYPVLSVEHVGEGTSYRLASEDNGTPVLFEVGMFELTDGALPAQWIAVVEDGARGVQLMPRAWAEEGFWERFFEGDTVAREVYQTFLDSLSA